MNERPATPSTLGRRSGAFLIDALIATIGTSMVLGIFLSPEDSDPAAIDPTLAAWISIAFISICFNYFAIAEWRWGQTIGKNILGLRVVAADSSKLSWNASSIRNLLRLVDVLAIGPILIARDGRRLGDRAARTLVVTETVGVKNYGITPPAPGEDGGASASPPPAPKPSAEKSAGVAATWSAPTVAAGILLAFVAILIGTIIVGAFDPSLESEAATAAAQAVFALSLIGTAVYFASREAAPGAVAAGGEGAAARLGLARFDGRTVKIAILGWGLYLLLAAVIAPLLEPEQDGIARELDDVAGTLAVVVAGLLIVVFAPLSEEIFFRGFVFAGLRTSVPFWAAAIVSAAIWGSLHLAGGNIGVVVQLTLFGLVLAWLYERSGSLWAPVIAHTINNAIAYTLLITNVI